MPPATEEDEAAMRAWWSRQKLRDAIDEMLGERAQVCEIATRAVVTGQEQWFGVLMTDSGPVNVYVRAEPVPREGKPGEAVGN